MAESIWLVPRPASQREPELHYWRTCPCSRYFYMLQCIAPGMLQLSPKDYDKTATVLIRRSIPRVEWIHANRTALSVVLGTGARARIKALIEASSSTFASGRELWDLSDEEMPNVKSKNSRRRPKVEGGGSGDIDIDQMGGQDWGACDKDCAWCGSCIYKFDLS